VKQLIIALFAGTLALSSMSVLAADPAQAEMKTDESKAETKTGKAKKAVKRKAHNTKVKAKKAVANRTTTDPASPNESRPATPPAK
jgi:hypothetical protein